MTTPTISVQASPLPAACWRRLRAVENLVLRVPSHKKYHKNWTARNPCSKGPCSDWQRWGGSRLSGCDWTDQGSQRRSGPGRPEYQGRLVEVRLLYFIKQHVSRYVLLRWKQLVFLLLLNLFQGRSVVAATNAFAIFVNKKKLYFFWAIGHCHYWFATTKNQFMPPWAHKLFHPSRWILWFMLNPLPFQHSVLIF